MEAGETLLREASGKDWRKKHLTAPKEQKEEPWSQAGCCRACWFARGERCSCRCKGRHHGLGHKLAEVYREGEN